MVVHRVVQWVACKVGKHFWVMIGGGDPFCLWCRKR